MDNKKKNPRLNLVGGEAVLEGVMMKHKAHYALAVRKEDGALSISEHEFHSIKERIKWLGWPVLRGIVNFIESIGLSYRVLAKSAEVYGVEETPDKFDRWLEKTFGTHAMDLLMGVSTVLAIVLALGLFLFVPIFLTKQLDAWIGPLGWWKNLLEGFIKIAIFIGYMLAVSKLKDIRRTFEYHGAEHKSIYCFEQGLPLTVENVKRMSRFHPRCGTNFIFVVLIVSILVFSLPFVTWEVIWLRMLTKLLLLPLVVGLCYEFLMYAGKHDNPLTRVCSAPGLWMQRITTKEPDSEQIEAALAALSHAFPPEYWQAYPDYNKDA